MLLWTRTSRRAVVVVVAALLSTSCADGGQPGAGPPSPASTATRSPVAAAPTAASSARQGPHVTAEPSAPAATPTATARSTGQRGQRPVIVIDPGHSGRSIRSTDKATGLRDIDYPNYPEIYEMFDVSTCVARALRRDGYRVLLTKPRALSSVSHAERAAVANHAHADLAISVHDDHGVSARFEATYDQRGVRGRDGRYGPMYRGRGSHRTVFALPAVAARSQQAARTIAQARTRAQGRPVSVTQNSFTGRDPLEPGNLALVQLFSTVPWVYNEMGARTGDSSTRAMTIAAERGYAAGLVAGVQAVVPPPAGATPTTPSARWLTSCLRQQVEPTPGTFTRPRRYLPAGF